MKIGLASVSAFEMPFIMPSNLPSGRNLRQIFQETFQQYAKNGWVLTKPLLAPTLKITLGAYACLILNYLFLNVFGMTLVALGHFDWMLLGMLLITAVTLWPFVTGFWEYLIFFVSLNRNAAEVFCKQPIQIKSAYELVLKENAGAYQLLLLVYFLIPVGLLLLLSVISFGTLLLIGQNMLTLAGSLIGVFLVQIAGGFISLIIALFLTFVFQIAAFEKLPLNPIPTLIKSVQMVWRRLPATLGLQIILAILTTLIAPGLIAWLSRIVKLSMLLDQAHLWLIHLILQGAAPGPANSLPLGYGQAFATIQAHIPEIASGATDTILSLIVTALLLPLGTLAFTRLYLDIRFSKQ